MASSNSYESQGQPRPLQMGAKGAYIVRLLMVGDSSCGKTSLVLRFDQNVFSTKFVTTIGVDYRDKMVKVRRVSRFSFLGNTTTIKISHSPVLSLLDWKCSHAIAIVGYSRARTISVTNFELFRTSGWLCSDVWHFEQTLVWSCNRMDARH